MKTINTLTFIYICILFQSCEPGSYVRLIKDRVRNTETYHLSISKLAFSKIERFNNKFDLQFIKNNIKLDTVDIIIHTNRWPSMSEFSNEIFLLAATQKYALHLQKIHEAPISEQNITNQTNTTYSTTTNHVPVTTTVHKTVNNQAVVETKTDIQVVQTQTPTHHNYQSVTETNYISEKYKLSVDINTLQKLCQNSLFTIRVYNKENDFWNLDFSYSNVNEIKNLLVGKVAPHNVSFN